MDIDLTPYKNEFIELLRSCKRDGIDDVINDLEEWGFFEAPASAGHHLNVKGGLVMHSLNTCKAALKVWEGMKELEPTLEKETPRESDILASMQDRHLQAHHEAQEECDGRLGRRARL